jgi:penicillin amidase
MIDYPGKAHIHRIQGAIPEITANSDTELYHALGYMHGTDRGMQLMFMKILGKGWGSEYLQSTEEMLKIDLFFRRMGWHKNIQDELSKLLPEEKSLLDQYCEGINEAFKKNKPWELKLLLGFKDFVWTPEDTILLIRMTGYLTLAQSQGEIERFFIQLVRFGVSKELLLELFPDILDDYDEKIIQNLKLVHPIVPEEVKWLNAATPMMASNNWVISGKRTKSGKPILANDPHLEINRLPNVWYEVSSKIGEDFIHGATMPGIPSFILGRNKNLSWGVTYSFMDAIDSWIEDCKGDKYRKGSDWEAFTVREEIIHRKKKDDHIVKFYDSEHGTLEGDPNELGDGYYLSTKWSGSFAGANTLSAGFKISKAKTAKEGMELAEHIEAAFSWVFADANDNIGFQMSGLMPKRNKHKGFTPLLGWEDTDWQGFHNSKDLPRSHNPDEGYIITANNNLNHLGKVAPINMPMAAYRAKRIEALLKTNDNSDIAFSKNIQYDLKSIHAEKFMQIILPLLDNSEEAEVLKKWDCRYNKESIAPTLFEKIYKQLYFEIFGNILDKELVDLIRKTTGIFVDFYENYDEVLLAESSRWFAGKTRDDIYASAIQKAFQEKSPTWGEKNSIVLKNILLGESLPSFLGFNRGPIPLEGGRATVHQGQVYTNGERTTSFGPSIRIVTDMATRQIETNYIGGVSDRRFSKMYDNDLDNWRLKRYKKFNY